MDEVKIPPRSEWREMSIQQLWDIKLQLSDKYYAMRSVGASFTNQFLVFISEIESLIAQKLAAESAEQEKDSN